MVWNEWFCYKKYLREIWKIYLLQFKDAIAKVEVFVK